MSKQYSLAEFYPAKKIGIESCGPGTKNTCVPDVHDMPSMQRAVVSYAAARNPYASSCVTHTSQQKVSHYPTTASTDGTDFNTPFLPDSTGDTSKQQ
eukprot:13578172-Ditylum_brightwellii.AAC.1